MPEYRDSNDTALNSLNQVAFSVGTIASYGCQRGYKLSCNGTKECLLTGEWSSPESVECKGIVVLYFLVTHSLITCMLMCSDRMSSFGKTFERIYKFQQQFDS